MVQFSHPYMTTGKTIALIIQTFVGKVMCLLLNTLPRFVIALLPKTVFKCPPTSGRAASSAESVVQLLILPRSSLQNRRRAL